MLNPNFVIVGVIIVTLGTLSYLVDTLKGRVKPNRVSFFMWSIAPLIAFAAQLRQGVGIQSLMTFSVGFLPLLIFIATFFNKKSEWKLTRFDFVCGFLSVVGLGLWLITRVGNIAIFFSIMADGLAGIPTLVKAYRYPETESAWPWLAAFLNPVFTILTITQWNFAYTALPIYFLLFNGMMYVFVKYKIGKIQTSV